MFADDDDDACPALVHAGADDAANNITNAAASEPPLARQQDDQSLAGIPAVPLVLLAGFLGSGKTTLIQYVLAAPHGLRLAVIVNEFEFGRSIEKGLTVRSAAAAPDEWVELRNGCMCCSAKNQSVQALEQLVAMRRGQLDAILVEAAGMADPVPIARGFWVDDALQAKVKLAGIVTVADAQNIARYVAGDRFVEAARQLLAADRIVLNKADAVGSAVVFEDSPDVLRSLLLDDAAPECVDRRGAATATAAAPPTAATPALREALATVHRVNPVAPVILCSLRALLGGQEGDAQAQSEQPLVPLATLRKLLMLDAPVSDRGAGGDGDDAAAVAAACAPPSAGWLAQSPMHQHTTGLSATQIEVTGRAFADQRAVDYFYAALLDNSVDGQDDADADRPAQLRAMQEGGGAPVMVRSKAALWVATGGGGGGGAGGAGGDSDSAASYQAVQVQSIGATFEVAAMAGLNALGPGARRDEILTCGTNRLLLLGFGLEQQAIRDALIAATRAI